MTLLLSVLSVNSVVFKYVKMKSPSAEDHFQWRSVIDFLFFKKKKKITVCVYVCGTSVGLQIKVISETLKQERIAPFQACVAMYLLPFLAITCSRWSRMEFLKKCGGRLQQTRAISCPLWSVYSLQLICTSTKTNKNKQPKPPHLSHLLSTK